MSRHREAAFRRASEELARLERVRADARVPLPARMDERIEAKRRQVADLARGLPMTLPLGDTK